MGGYIFKFVYDTQSVIQRSGILKVNNFVDGQLNKMLFVYKIMLTVLYFQKIATAIFIWHIERLDFKSSYLLGSV